MPFTSHLFEISLTEYKDPKKCVVNRISWPRGWGENLFMISLSLPFPLPLSAPSLANVCKVSTVVFRVKPGISSKYVLFNRHKRLFTGREKWIALWRGKVNGISSQLTSSLTTMERNRFGNKSYIEYLVNWVWYVWHGTSDTTGNI